MDNYPLYTVGPRKTCGVGRRLFSHPLMLL